MDSKILKALGIDPALIFLFLLVLIVILFVLYVNCLLYTSPSPRDRG